jgi:hypothetical protein
MVGGALCRRATAVDWMNMAIARETIDRSARSLTGSDSAHSASLAT